MRTRAPLICTDPPYYDNIGYADLSDFFYVWLRRRCATSTRLFSTLLVQSQELVATPTASAATSGRRRLLRDGARRGFRADAGGRQSGLPLTVYYAFKQAESEEGGLEGSTPRPAGRRC